MNMEKLRWILGVSLAAMLTLGLAGCDEGAGVGEEEEAAIGGEEGVVEEGAVGEEGAY